MKTPTCSKCGKNDAEYSETLKGYTFCSSCRKVKNVLHIENVNRGIPKRYSNAKLEDFPDGLISLLKEKSENFKLGLVVYGDCQLGKTYLLSAIANSLEGVLFYSFVEFINDLRGTIKDNTTQDFLEDVCNAPYLFFDDLLVEKSTDFIYENLYYIINHRYIEELPTFISFNGDFKKTEKIDDRLKWRMMESSVEFPLKKNYKK